MAYFLGMLGNLLPLPGGIGGVDGGMIGAFIAFGVDSQLAIVAVLAYRGFSFWLPDDPGRDRRTSSCAARSADGPRNRPARRPPEPREIDCPTHYTLYSNG